MSLVFLVSHVTAASGTQLSAAFKALRLNWGADPATRSNAYFELFSLKNAW